LELERGGLRVGLGFEEGAPRRGALREGGGEERGERVREEGVYFGGVQDWLKEGIITFLLRRECPIREGGVRDRP
jgi:hypothetical protein